MNNTATNNDAPTQGATEAQEKPTLTPKWHLQRLHHMAYKSAQTPTECDDADESYRVIAKLLGIG